MQAFIPAPRATPEEEKAIAYLKTVIAKSQRGASLTRQERKNAASKLEFLARSLRRSGGAENLRAAAQMEQMAQAFRTQSHPTTTAARQAPQKRRMSSNEAYARAIADLQSRHNNYVFMSNMSTINHVGTMNMISAMSGGPSYSVRYR